MFALAKQVQTFVSQFIIKNLKKDEKIFDK